ncbi:MAG TPA: tyramine oxidase, partial [Ktedonobacter sp.]|nr:tyramine oxidase [Ktedonobacter sp.]
WDPEDAAEQGRLIRLQATISKGPEDNYYAHPIEGVIITVELDSMKVVKIEDHGVVPVPERAGNYTTSSIAKSDNVPYFPEGTRKDLKPISITQPNGVSFQVTGHEVSWQKWRFRVGFTP